MKQKGIAGSALCMIGLFLLATPSERLWILAETWKTEGEGKLSRAYAAGMRILGIGLAAAGIAVAACGIYGKC